MFDLRLMKLVAAFGVALIVLSGGSVQAQLAGVEVLAKSVRRDEAVFTNVLSVSDGQGGQFVLWRRTESGSAQATLRAQHLDRNAEPQWSAEGEAVGSSGAHHDQPVLMADGMGGCIVAWEEHRSGNVRVYLQRLTASGKRAWPERGIPASVGARRQYRPALATDYQGGAFVFWEEEVTANDRDVVGQRVSAAGAFLFKPIGIQLSSGSGLQQSVQLAPTPSQGVIVLWEDFRSGVRWQLFAQQISLDGRQLWPSGGASLAPPRAVAQRYPSVFGDGFGGLVCVYEALGGLNLDRDLYAVRVNRSGSQVYHAPVAVRRADQTRPVAQKIGSEAYVVWEDYRAETADVYVQRFDLATGVMGLGVDGVPVAEGPGDQRQPTFVFTSLAGTPAIGWHDAPEAPKAARWCVRRVDAEGQGLSPVMELPGEVAAVPLLSLVSDERGGAWLTRLAGEPDAQVQPMTQALTQSGKWLLPGAGRAIVELGKAEFIRMDQVTVAQGLDGDGYVAWEDFRAGEKNPDLYVQRVDGKGRPKWRLGGVRVCAAEGLQSVPVLCPVAGGVVIGWLDRRTPDDNLYIQFVDSSGRLRWREEGLPLCLAPRSQSNLRLVRIAGRELMAFWTDARSFTTSGFDVFYQRIDLDGRFQLAQDGVPLATGPAYQNSVTAASDGTGRTLVVWAEEDNGVYGLRGQSFWGAQPQWGNGRWLAPSAGQQRSPQLALTRKGAAWLAWCEERTPGLGQVYVTQLNPEGEAAWSPKRISASQAAQTEPRLRVVGEDALVLWQDARWAEASGLHRLALRVLPSGGSLWSGPVDLGAFVPENRPSDVAAASETFGLGLVEDARTQPALLAQTRFEPSTGRVVQRGAVRATAANQRWPQLLPLPNRRLAAVWIEQVEPQTGGGATDARVLLKLVE